MQSCCAACSHPCPCRYQAYELIHARWAMLGAAGFVLPEAFNKFGAVCGPEAVWWKVRYRITKLPWRQLLCRTMIVHPGENWLPNAEIDVRDCSDSPDILSDWSVVDSMVTLFSTSEPLSPSTYLLLLSLRLSWLEEPSTTGRPRSPHWDWYVHHLLSS